MHAFFDQMVYHLAENGFIELAILGERGNNRWNNAIGLKHVQTPFLLFLVFDGYVSNLLVIMQHAGMVFLLVAIRLDGLHDLHHLCGNGHRRTDGMGSIQRIIQILDVQLNSETGFEITIHHHRRLGVHDGGTSQTAADGLVDEFRISPGLGRKGEGFRNRCDIGCDNDLIG